VQITEVRLLCLRAKELRSIEAKARFGRLNVDMAEKTTGSLPFITLNELRATALSNEALVQAAKAELSLARHELKLDSVTAPIDGEIAWLVVSKHPAGTDVEIAAILSVLSVTSAVKILCGLRVEPGRLMAIDSEQ
jgi:hypothetical protein